MCVQSTEGSNSADVYTVVQSLGKFVRMPLKLLRPIFFLQKILAHSRVTMLSSVYQSTMV